MKTLKHLFTALLLLCSSVAFAQKFEVDGIYYNITSSTDKTVEVKSGTNKYTGDVVIPESVVYNDVTYSVTSIGSSAFYYCTGLTSIVIPSSVTSIGDNAFEDCRGLTSVEIPSSVTSIGDNAFYDCTGLTSVEIPNSVTSIGNYAFRYCSKLNDVHISDIAAWCSIDFGNSTANPMYYANNLYLNGDLLTELVIPDGVTEIKNNAFCGCTGLTSVVIPNSVTSIGYNAFSGTAWYNNQPDGVVYAGKVLYRYKGTMPSNTSITITDGTLSITGSAFYDCTGLTSITIPNSVTSIGEDAFDGCTSLKELRIEDGESTLSLANGTAQGNGYYYISGLFSPCPLETLYLGRNLSYDIKPFANIATLESVVIGGNVTTIESRVFNGFTGLTSVVIGGNVTTIESYAFEGCSGLTSIVIPNSVTSIGKSAFDGCMSLKELRIEDGESTLSLGSGFIPISSSMGYTVGLFAPCPLETLYLGRNLSYESGPFANIATLESVVIGGSVTTIKSAAFSGTAWYDNHPDGVVYAGKALYKYKGTMPANTSMVIKEGTTVIADYAFSGCGALVSVEIPSSVTGIGQHAFSAANAVFDIAAETPATLGSSAFHANAVLIVPDAAVDTYKAAWSGYAAQIAGRNDAYVAVDVEAMDATSGIMERIGLEKMASIAKLAVKGSINSYDVIQFRDKMPLLRELDLSEATVVASDKAFYNGNCTKDNDLGGYAFYNLSKLNFVKLPKDLAAVGTYAFYGCSSLREIELPETMQSIGSYAFYGCSSLKSAELPTKMTSIGSYAFYNCDALKEIKIPAGVKSINHQTFYDCNALERVILPDGLETIGSYAFRYCRNLKEIKLPPTVKKIDYNAFEECSSLEEIRIPSSVTSIGSSAFANCNNLKKVYTYTVEPTAIQESTFSTFQTATLYVPSFSFSNYYWDDGWKRFLNLAEFNEPYEYFYVNNDYTLNDDTGYIEGVEGKNPDADINAGGGFIVEGEQGDEEEPNQSLGDVNVGSNGEGTSGSIIGNNNLHIDDLHIRINVKGGRWYFFAFPFDIFFKDITMENGSDYVFRYYDGEERANKGNGGWKDINENHLKAARGYIFQCSANDVLVLNIKDVKFKKEDKYNELVAHVSENLKDASWNFTGNPYLSYYDLADMDYSAPVTVWDGSKYVAIRPGDDDYHFAPYEAFFVQKPEEQESIAFDGEEQMTQNQSNKKKEKQAAARRARGIDPERQLINLVLGNGTSDDRTRIVFNERQSLAYETACDATKFSTAGVTQLYTIGNDKVHYAINERPADNGVVMLGYTAPVAGFYTIEAQRMDAEVFVKDYKTGTLHNLSDGAYSFGTDAGTFNDRFEILLKGTAPGTTDIDEVKGENGEVKTVYDLQGRKMQDAGKGIYIIDGEKVILK